MQPGDTLAFRLGDLLPPDDPLSEWLALLAMALNDLAFVHARLEEDSASPFRYLYWLRLGIAHFFEGAKLLKRGRDVPQVSAFVATLPDEARAMHSSCISIYDERHEELKMMRDVLFHYARTWSRRGRDPEPVIQSALRQLSNERTSVKTGRLFEARLLFADDLSAAIFTRATGVGWDDVTRAEAQEHVGAIELRIKEAVTSFVRFATPALMEHMGRAIGEGMAVQQVEPIDPDDLRKGYRIVGTS